MHLVDAFIKSDLKYYTLFLTLGIPWAQTHNLQVAIMKVPCSNHLATENIQFSIRGVGGS